MAHSAARRTSAFAKRLGGVPDMPTEKNDRTIQWTLDQSDSRYTLARKATITVSEGYGIYESTQNNSIVVLGDIMLSQGATAGVRFKGATSSVEIGEHSTIDARSATYGIFAEGAGQHIVNSGDIKGGATGIHGEIWGEVENFGTITGEIGIHYLGEGSQIDNLGTIHGDSYGIVSGSYGTSIVNGRGAVISGDLAAITLLGSGAATIVNNGVIKGGVNAIQGEAFAMTVTNNGRIVGDVSLSDGDDRFDTTEGRMNGVIRGGEGDDFYFISKSGTKIEDFGASFNDSVFSSASYKLVGGLDHLELTGTRDVNATGNIGSNILDGNDGDNRISGMEGDDAINGGRGDDTLTGGSGRDAFTFDRNGDIDRIKDFEDGLDWIRTSYIRSASDFNALEISSIKGGDLLLDFGHDNRLILEGIAEADFTIADFLLP
jgi:Ca2+-binding RTX toxin-like protein